MVPQLKRSGGHAIRLGLRCALDDRNDPDNQGNGQQYANDRPDKVASAHVASSVHFATDDSIVTPGNCFIHEISKSFRQDSAARATAQSLSRGNGIVKVITGPPPYAPACPGPNAGAGSLPKGLPVPRTG